MTPQRLYADGNATIPKVMPPKAKKGLDQRQRLLVLLVSLASLLFVGWIVDGSLVPAPASASLWFYSAALALLFADLIVEPWYTSPADAATNAAAVLLSTFAASSEGLPISDATFSTGRTACIIVAGVIFSAALLAMFTRRGGKTATQSQLHRIAFYLSSSIGRAKVIFGAFFAVTAAAAFADSSDKLLLLYLFGSVVLWSSGIKLVFERFVDLRVPPPQPRLCVVEIAQPRTAFLSSEGTESARIGQPILQGGMNIGTIVDASEVDASKTYQAVLDPQSSVKQGDLIDLGPAEDIDDRVLGVAGNQTALDRLVIRGSGSRFDAAQLREGGLIEVPIRENNILYQIVDAEIEGASPDASAKSKRIKVVSRKLGHWDGGEGTFLHADWVPSPSSIVKATAAERQNDVDTGLVGRVPGTDYGAAYDPITGATHNTAILGILGVGKTTLAAELAWRTLGEGARVIVIDITNEYAQHFQELFGPEDQVTLEDEINTAIAPRQNSKDYEGDSAGNQGLLKRAIRERLKTFFEGDDRLLIINPTRIVATRDDGGYPTNSGLAKRLVSLNPAEVTAIVARAVLGQVENEITDSLRVCLVLEEAHSLAPEWNSTANDGEKQAATATARSLMQGRKFGFGSIVVTQRTATVTKSILNQCNTVFAMRVYDQTGTEFLGNFIGSDYARLLANLPDHSAVMFGKASSCHSPLLVELNNPADLGNWREEIARRLREGATAVQD